MLGKSYSLRVTISHRRASHINSSVATSFSIFQPLVSFSWVSSFVVSRYNETSDLSRALDLIHYRFDHVEYLDGTWRKACLQCRH